MEVDKEELDHAIAFYKEKILPALAEEEKTALNEGFKEADSDLDGMIRDIPNWFIKEDGLIVVDIFNVVNSKWFKISESVLDDTAKIKKAVILLETLIKMQNLVFHHMEYVARDLDEIVYGIRCIIRSVELLEIRFLFNHKRLKEIPELEFMYDYLDRLRSEQKRIEKKIEDTTMSFDDCFVDIDIPVTEKQPAPEKKEPTTFVYWTKTNAELLSFQTHLEDEKWINIGGNLSVCLTELTGNPTSIWKKEAPQALYLIKLMQQKGYISDEYEPFKLVNSIFKINNRTVINAVKPLRKKINDDDKTYYVKKLEPVAKLVQDYILNKSV